jgi:hypothetical protein
MRIKFLLFVLLFLPIKLQAALDSYGGDGSNPCVGTLPVGGAIPGATGFFYLYKDTNLHHWMWCDPIGNRFWQTAVQVVDYGGLNYTTIANAKYGAFGSATGWEAIQTKRLQAMGFNTVGEFSRRFLWPPVGNNPNPIAFNWFVSPAHYTLGLKDIYANLPPVWDAVDGWRGFRSLDLYDPVWQALGTGLGGNLWDCPSTIGVSCATVDASPWLMLTTMDDVAYVSAIYTGQSTYMVGITAPYEQFENSFGYGRSQIFSDPIMHTKQQWGTWLCGTRYANLAALNAAWGSSYTSCGSVASTSGTETIGTGNGSLTSFTYTFLHTPVDPASIGISVGGVLQGGDSPWFNYSNRNSCVSPSGQGCIQVTTGNINGGTVTYSTGAITVTFSVAPANGVAITATYQYNGWPKSMMQTYSRTQSATDNFTRANGGLGANWTTTTGLPAPVISSNTVIPGGTQGSGSGAFYNGVVWPNDQYSTVTLGTLDSFGEAGSAVRISASANTQYFCQVKHQGAGVTVQLAKFVAGVFTVLASGTFTVNSGDTLTTQAIGSNISCVQNGGSTAILSAVDSSITSGNAGLLEYVEAGGAVSGTHITSWAGGSASIVQSGGTGILDEDGTSSWWPAGDPVSLTSFPDPPVGVIQTDMDVFLGLHVTQYVHPVHDWIKNNLPHHMVGSVDQAGYGRRLQSYTATTNYADVLLYSNSTTTFSAFQTPTVAEYNSVPKPVYVGVYSTAQPDSRFSATACPYAPALCFTTQDAKGAFYLDQAKKFWNSIIGADTYHFIVGINYWQYTDNSSESGAYGLVSLNDNLYGYPPACPTKKEDVNSSIVDCYGLTTTAEAATYGNFIQSGVVTGNAIWLQPSSTIDMSISVGISLSPRTQIQ